MGGAAAMAAVHAGGPLRERFVRPVIGIELPPFVFLTLVSSRPYGCQPPQSRP